jgi:hypothetical protein
VELADLAQQVDAVGVREAHVEDDDVRMERGKLGQRLRPGPRERHLVPRLEVTAVGAAEVRFVLDEEDPAKRFRGIHASKPCKYSTALA